MTQQAFIAMRFSDDPWRDKVYLAIREELEKANYKCIRSDEIRTSGPVVDEVCRLLAEADLVVIDSSGDSHSVSYEIGYCHGIGRSSDSTLLLKDNAELPFNYRHYRHRVYRDVRHLRRLVRDYLGLIEPIRPDALGRVYSFDFSEDATYGYIFDGAKCVCLTPFAISSTQDAVSVTRPRDFNGAESLLWVSCCVQVIGRRNLQTNSGGSWGKWLNRTVCVSPQMSR